MTRIDIFSGFLGAGKTTLIKKLIAEAYTGEKLVLIENEFGEIGIDGGFLKDAGITITEMNSGCICCSLVGDFGRALEKVLDEYAPDRILIEPSGVGKLSDVIAAVQGIHREDIRLNSLTTVVDAKKYAMYAKNFGEFFNNQITYANTVVLSHTDSVPMDKLAACASHIRSANPGATVVTTSWNQLTGAQIVEAMEHKNTLSSELKALLDHETVCPVCGHHHDHDDDHEHEHSHHDHDHEHCHHDHDHEHDHHDHDHVHHHADDIFMSWGMETTAAYSQTAMKKALDSLQDTAQYGTVLRAKGIVPGADGAWLHFDYIPGEPDVRTGAAGVTGRLCVIGADLNAEALQKLFTVGEDR